MTGAYNNNSLASIFHTMIRTEYSVIYHIIHGNARLRQKMETGEQICFSQTFIIPVAFLGRDTDD